MIGIRDDVFAKDLRPMLASLPDAVAAAGQSRIRLRTQIRRHPRHRRSDAGQPARASGRGTGTRRPRSFPTWRRARDVGEDDHGAARARRRDRRARRRPEARRIPAPAKPDPHQRSRISIEEADPSTRSTTGGADRVRPAARRRRRSAIEAAARSPRAPRGALQEASVEVDQPPAHRTGRPAMARALLDAREGRGLGRPAREVVALALSRRQAHAGVDEIQAAETG